MSTIVPERWKESLEQVRDRIGNFLERLRPLKGPDNGPEHVTTGGATRGPRYFKYLSR